MPQVDQLGRNEETGSYSRTGIRLDDGGRYDFRLFVDFGRRDADLTVSNLFSPTLGLVDKGFSRSELPLDEFKVGIPFIFIEVKITTDGGRCSSGCDAFAAALLINDHQRLAASAVHIVGIMPPSTDLDPHPSPVMTTQNQENTMIRRSDP
jgi:hypothetical protein